MHIINRSRKRVREEVLSETKRAPTNRGAESRMECRGHVGPSCVCKRCSLLYNFGTLWRSNCTYPRLLPVRCPIRIFWTEMHSSVRAPTYTVAIASFPPIHHFKQKTLEISPHLTRARPRSMSVSMSSHKTVARVMSPPSASSGRLVDRPIVLKESNEGRSHRPRRQIGRQWQLYVLCY